MNAESTEWQRIKIPVQMHKNTPETYASGVESFSCFASGLIRYDLQWNFMSHGESLQVALQN